MAQDEASKKAHENMAFKIASKVAQGFYAMGPQGVVQIFGELKKLIPFMSGDVWNSFCNGLAAGDNPLCDQDTADGLKSLSDYPFPWGGILMIMTLLKVKMTDLEALMNIYSLDRQYKTLQHTTPNPAPIDNLVRSMIIDPGRSTENRATLKKHGFDDTQINNIILSYYRTIDEGTLRTAYLRKEITESRLYERMRELGYTDERTKEIVSTWVVLPGPQDLFTMVAKEAFEPDIYRTLGLDREFPAEQVEWLEKQGISQEWARKYWIAHWEEPSIGQGFEMLHRNVIGPGELDMLFRAVEIPDYWRDKLTKIAYNPYTRVDVRRMHDLGILSDQDLIRSYMDLGFDSEKALNMANFTIEFNASHEKELTRGALLESYNEGLISRTEASGLLLEQNYSQELIDYYLELEDYNRDKALQKQRIDNTRDEMLLNRITSATARSRLNSMGLRGETIDVYLETWELDRYKYQIIPSKSELDNFLVKGIIDQGQWREAMTRHGYSSMYIGWYLDEMRRELEVTRRMPSKADLGSWYKKNVITQDQYYEDMRRLGYSDVYITRYFNTL